MLGLAIHFLYTGLVRVGRLGRTMTLVRAVLARCFWQMISRNNIQMDNNIQYFEHISFKTLDE